MSLSVARNAAAYGPLLGYGLAGLSAASLVADAPQQRSSGAPSWSWTPPSTGSGRRDAHLSTLMAVLSQFSSSGPDGTAPGGSDQGSGKGSGSSSSTDPAQSDAADLLQALNNIGAAPASSALDVSQGGSSELDRLPVQDLAQRASAAATSALSVGASTQDATGDPSISAADAQLEALFKTLQAYGL